jgi:autotransporter-associated beta strand protein
LSGPITRAGQQTRVQVESGSTLDFRGGVTGGNAQFVTTLMSGTACMAFYEKPVNIGAQALYIEGAGLTIIGIAGNTWGQTCVVGAGSTLRLSVANALPATTSLKLGYDAIRNITVDLNGFDQTVGELLHYVTPTTGNQGITSQTPATLTVNQSSSTLFAGPLTGALSLTKIGTGTLTLSNSLSSTTGNITVTNGTLVAACANSLGNSTNITVTGSAARLELRTSSGINNTATLMIANDGAKVNLAADVNETVGYLTFNGKIQRAGTYSATAGSGVNYVDAGHFMGAGVLTVLRDNSGTVLRVY